MTPACTDGSMYSDSSSIVSTITDNGECMPRQEHGAQGTLFAHPSYFEELGAISLLSEVEEREIVYRVVRGDAAAREQLIVANLRLVVHFAKPYARYVSDAEYSDLIQEGNIGLIAAVDSVDDERNNKFSTYAKFHIRKAILDLLSSNGKLIHIPAKISAMMRTVVKTEYVLAQELGRSPTKEEIARKMEIPLERLYELEQTSRTTMSLDSSPFESEGGSTLIPSDLVADTSLDSVEDLLGWRVVQKAVRNAVASLRPRDARIAVLRFGLNGTEPMTLNDIGKIEGGVTRERIRAIEERILRHLRAHPEIQKLSLSCE